MRSIPFARVIGVGVLILLTLYFAGCDGDDADENIAPAPMADENIAPAPMTDVFSVAQNTMDTLQIDANDPDMGQMRTFTITSEPQDGTAEIDAATGQLTYTPEPDFFGEDSVEVTVTDNGTPSLSGAVLIEIQVIIPEVASLQERTFVFAAGFFGIPSQVTMTVGTLGVSTGPLRVTTADGTAIGRLAFIVPPLCDLTFTSSTLDIIPLNVVLNPSCELNEDGSLTIGGATSAPPTVVAPNLTGLVYTQSNIPAPNSNTILAFRRDADGALTLLPEAPFPTGGAGISIDPDTLQPDDAFDSDQNIILNPERTLLFTVNGGSDTIAVFYILPDGALVPVADSPFPSSGINPVSLGLAGRNLYVVNKNRDILRRDPTQSLPNYTGLRVGLDGELTPIPNSTVATLQNASSSQALVSRFPTNNLLFGADFGIMQLQSFQIDAQGVLLQNEPLSLLNVPVGLQAHPTEPLLYVAFPDSNELAVFSYDAQGVFDTNSIVTVPNEGADACWVEVNQAATRLYTANSGNNTVSIYDLTNPREPVQIQLLDLAPGGGGCPFQLGFGSDEAYLYLISQRCPLADPAIPLGEGNLLRVLQVNADGTLTEVGSSPTNLNQLGGGTLVPTDPFGRPQGIAAP